MGRADHLRLGTWNAICDRCGFKFKADQLKAEWTGLKTCHGPHSNHCWELRNPQDFVKGVADRQGPPWARPEPPEIDVSIGSGNEVSADDL